MYTYVHTFDIHFDLYLVKYLKVVDIGTMV